MLNVKIDKTECVALLEPNGALSKQDFESAAMVVDSYLETAEKLSGLVIYTKDFPGWDSFAALSSHLRFVKDHHKVIARVAFATDSVLGSFAEKVASHFVNAEIKVFSYQELDQARAWASKG